MTPQLRFPEFTDEWQVKKLGDVFDEVTDKVGTKGIETYSITAGKGFVSQKEKFGQDISGTQNERYTLLREGDLSYNKGNSKTYNYGCVYENKTGKQIAVPNVFISFRLKNKNMRPGFYGQMFINRYLDPYLLKIISSGARMDGLLNVNKKEFFSINVPVASIEEQEKIADFLTAVDERIRLGEQRLVSLEQYKRGVMQQIFSQKIRFKDENGNEYPVWEEKKLGEIATIKTGKKDANIAKSNGRYRFYTCSRDYLRTDIYSFEGEAILVAGNADVGLCHYYDGKFEAYQRTYVLQNFEIDGKFLYKYLSHFFRQYALGLMQTSAMTYITLGTLHDFTVPLPSEVEQQKIATFLTALDDKITAEKSKLTAAKQFKKALLQRMFV